MRKGPSKIDRAIEPSIKAVARRGQGYFLKAEIRAELFRRLGIGDAIIDVRRRYRTMGLDEAIIHYVDTAISRGLQAKDEHGLRLYECYSVGTGERRWRRFRDMTVFDVTAVLRDCRTLKANIEDKIALYELVLEEMRHCGPEAKVSAVYDRVVDALAA